MLASVGVFFASVSLSPLDKEMKCRPAQGLMELSKKLQHITSANEGRTTPNPKRERPTLTKQENPTYNSLRLKQNRPTLNSLRLKQNRPTSNSLRPKQNHPHPQAHPQASHPEPPNITPAAHSPN